MTTVPINRITSADVEQFLSAPTFKEYQYIAVRNSVYPGKGTPFGLMYAALALGEQGEVQGKIKKAFRDDGLIQSVGPQSDTPFESLYVVEFSAVSVVRRTQIIKELGGLLWYMAAVCQELDTTLEEVALANLDQLRSRTQRGTLSGDGDDR